MEGVGKTMGCFAKDLWNGAHDGLSNSMIGRVGKIAYHFFQPEEASERELVQPGEQSAITWTRWLTASTVRFGADLATVVLILYTVNKVYSKIVMNSKERIESGSKLSPTSRTSVSTSEEISTLQETCAEASVPTSEEISALQETCAEAMARHKDNLNYIKYLQQEANFLDARKSEVTKMLAEHEALGGNPDYAPGHENFFLKCFVPKIEKFQDIVYSTYRRYIGKWYDRDFIFNRLHELEKVIKHGNYKLRWQNLQNRSGKAFDVNQKISKILSKLVTKLDKRIAANANHLSWRNEWGEDSAASLKAATDAAKAAIAAAKAFAAAATTEAPKCVADLAKHARATLLIPTERLLDIAFITSLCFGLISKLPSGLLSGRNARNKIAAEPAHGANDAAEVVPPPVVPEEAPAHEHAVFAQAMGAPAQVNVRVLQQRHLVHAHSRIVTPPPLLRKTNRQIHELLKSHDIFSDSGARQSSYHDATNLSRRQYQRIHTNEITSYFNRRR